MSPGPFFYNDGGEGVNLPRLSVQLIPRNAWQRNVRAVVAYKTWDVLRWYFGATRYRPLNAGIALWKRHRPTKLMCAYCKTEHQQLHLHEEWDYDDTHRIQKLVGLVPVCEQCHLATHMGYANVVGRAEEAMKHLAKINRWTMRQVKAHCNRAFKQWGLRSQFSYTLNVDYLLAFVPQGKIHFGWLDSPKTWIGSRLDAIVWAKRLLESDALIVDTETTGLLDKLNVEVIEIAAINMKGKSVYHGLFKPKYKIPVKVIKIHHITNERVKSSLAFSDKWERIERALKGRVIVAYNAEFDRRVLARTCQLHKVEMFDARWECAMWAYKYFSESGPFKKLPNGAHRALADCHATLRLMKRMARANL